MGTQANGRWCLETTPTASYVTTVGLGTMKNLPVNSSWNVLCEESMSIGKALELLGAVYLGASLFAISLLSLKQRAAYRWRLSLPGTRTR